MTQFVLLRSDTVYNLLRLCPLNYIFNGYLMSVHSAKVVFDVLYAAKIKVFLTEHGLYEQQFPPARCGFSNVATKALHECVSVSVTKRE